MRQPEISVVVPSHNRALRLRWLLNALEDQTLSSERWEVVVAHDSRDGGETQRLLTEHPLARSGVLRHLEVAPIEGNSASRLRNAAWREAGGDAIAFTDDDCRPPPEWLERALTAVQSHPGAIVQGATRRDPDELVELSGQYVHSQTINPPSPYAETCNIVYPRSVLDAVGGFVEDPPLAAGEDTDLALRAQKEAGADYVGAPEVVTYHAVQAVWLGRWMRSTWRWGDLAWLVRRHPEAREWFYLWTFWKPRHVWLPFALAGLLLSRRRPGWLAAAIPWAIHATPWHGHDPRGRLRALSELPGQLLSDTAEFAALVRGSIKHRSPFL